MNTHGRFQPIRAPPTRIRTSADEIAFLSPSVDEAELPRPCPKDRSLASKVDDLTYAYLKAYGILRAASGHPALEFILHLLSSFAT